MSKISASEIRPGQFLLIDDQLWRILKTERQKPGKGGAFVQTYTKSIKDTSKEYRFRTDETVELARLEEYSGRFLYKQDDEYHFMNLDTAEILVMNTQSMSVSVGKDYISMTPIEMIHRIEILDSDTAIKLLIYDNTLLSVELPLKVNCKVDEITSSSGGTKAARIKDIKVTVPQYIEVGECITINMGDFTFVQRAK